MNLTEFEIYVSSQVRDDFHPKLGEILQACSQVTSSSGKFAKEKLHLELDWSLIVNSVFWLDPSPYRWKPSHLNYYFIEKYLLYTGLSWKKVSHLSNIKLAKLLMKQLDKRNFQYRINKTIDHINELQQEISKINKYDNRRLYLSKQHKKYDLGQRLQNLIRDANEEQNKLLSARYRNISDYRKSAEFYIPLHYLPHIRGYDNLVRLGWFHPKHNITGVVKDHRFSIFEGFTQQIDPSIIGHIVNCELLTVRENSSKNYKSSVTLEDLRAEIKKWKSS